MSVSNLVKLAGVPFAATVVVLAAFGAWPWSSRAEEEAAENIVLDKDEIGNKLNSGLDFLSNADGRSTGEGQYVDPSISIADAELARRIADAVSPPEEPRERKGGWFW